MNIQPGDKLLWGEMPGLVVDTRSGYIQVEWEDGYDKDLSGGTNWCPASWVGVHIELVGDNGHKPKPPESLIDPAGRDLFAEAFQLSFEL